MNSPNHAENIARQNGVRDAAMIGRRMAPSIFTTHPAMVEVQITNIISCLRSHSNTSDIFRRHAVGAKVIPVRQNDISIPDG
jgi:hypothetical protein